MANMAGKGEMAETKIPGAWYQRLATYLLYDCLWMAWISIVGLWVELSGGPPKIRVEEIPKRTGQVAIITGGPRGLAVGLIKRLLQLDYTLVMGVRNIADSERRFREFAESNPELPMNNVRFLEMDLMSLNTIRKFADEVNAQVPRIDLLLCNAANMREPYVLTEDGYESQFQVNYLSHFMLSELLLEKLKETAASKGAPCQIIYTSSVMHEVGKFYFEELEKPKVYTRNKFYYSSKLCQVTGMISLNKRLEKEKAQVYCYAVHPGLVPTELWYNGLGSLAMLIGNACRPLFRTLENGADTILWPAFSPEFQNRGGVYMANGRERTPSREARNEENQSKLYEKSLQLIQATVV